MKGGQRKVKVILLRLNFKLTIDLKITHETNFIFNEVKIYWVIISSSRYMYLGKYILFLSMAILEKVQIGKKYEAQHSKALNHQSFGSI